MLWKLFDKVTDLFGDNEWVMAILAMIIVMAPVVLVVGFMFFCLWMMS